MANQKHLTSEQRVIIQTMLAKKNTFTEISKILDKHKSTISKEIRSHISIVRSGFKYISYNSCRNRKTCDKTHVCKVCNPDKRYKKCANCPACNNNCSDFILELCPTLSKPPYVCNGCAKTAYGCALEKHFYYADEAQKKYLELLKECRSGFSFSEDEVKHLDDLISPLIKQGQSPHHICVTNPDTIMISESTIYRLIDSTAIAARNMDLTRKVRFKKRRNPVHFKVDKTCRVGRTYQDYLHFLEENPDIAITQLDSVEGKKGGKVLLTIHFVKAEMMLAFIREHNDSRSVTEIFNKLYEILGHDHFTAIFKLCLADNGSEFSNPRAIEFVDENVQRTRVFYCNPSAPYEKGSAEHNHEFIRRFIPKGEDLSPYSQDDISLMMDHINSYVRGSLGDKSPYEMFAFLYGKEVLDLLGRHSISPQNVTLNKSIFNREV